MTFYIDLDLLRVVATPGYSSPVDAVRVRRGDTVPFVVQFSQGGVAVDPGAAATSLVFAANSAGNSTPDPTLVTAGAFTKSGTGTDTIYTANVVFSGTEINVGFNVGRNLETLNAMASFTWLNATGSTQASTAAFALEIANNIYRGASATVPAQSSALFLPGVTTLIGGGAASLDGVLTATVAVPQVYVLSISNSSQLWALVAGTNAEDAAGGIVRGDDFHISSNAKVFKRIG